MLPVSGGFADESTIAGSAVSRIGARAGFGMRRPGPSETAKSTRVYSLGLTSPPPKRAIGCGIVAAFSVHENAATREKYGGGAAAQPDADGGTACLACIARTGAPHGAAPPHSVTIQACSYMYKS